MVTTQLKILFLNQETPPTTFFGDLPPHSPTLNQKADQTETEDDM